MSSIHVFCLPSYHEGLSVAILEALASGAIVVTTDIPGCKDAILNGEIGFLTKVKDEKELSNTLEKVLLLKEYPSFAYKGRKIVEDVYSNRVIHKKYLGLYQEIFNVKNN